jgi:hypothetical protein
MWGEQVDLIAGIIYPFCVTFGILWGKPEAVCAWADPVSQNVDEASILASPGA